MCRFNSLKSCKETFSVPSPCASLFFYVTSYSTFSSPPYLICDEQRERRTASGVPTCLSFLTPPSFGHLPYMANATQRRSVEFYTIFNLFSFQDFRYMKFIHYQAEGED